MDPRRLRPPHSAAPQALLSSAPAAADDSVLTWCFRTPSIPFEGTIVNITLSRSTTHPPDTEDREVLQIPRDDELRELGIADRLSLRIGLWLFQRAQRPRRPRRSWTVDPGDLFLVGEQRHRSAAESHALLMYDMQRGMR